MYKNIIDWAGHRNGTVGSKIILFSKGNIHAGNQSLWWHTDEQNEIKIIQFTTCWTIIFWLAIVTACGKILKLGLLPMGIICIRRIFAVELFFMCNSMVIDSEPKRPCIISNYSIHWTLFTFYENGVAASLGYHRAMIHFIESQRWITSN